MRSPVSEVHSVAVFCGASIGNDPAFMAAAAEFGLALAHAGMRLVYGGGRIGLMGAVADAVLGAGGEVVGVIPDFLMRQEVMHDGVRDLIVTDSMHTRKRRMFDMADAFVILPGGLGTMDEAMEIITWRQLKLHDKPILFCDIKGSARPLVAAIEAAVAWEFARSTALGLFEVVEGVDATISRLAELRATPPAASTRL